MFKPSSIFHALRPRSSSHRAAPHRGRGTAPEFGRLESLEPRRLLAADLDVDWDLEQLDLPTRLVPGDRVLAPILIFNDGPNAANGLVTINFYLSSDTSLNTSSDVLLRSYRSEPLFLSVYDGTFDTVGTFTGDLQIPPDVAPGDYHFIVRITPNAAIDDTNPANNVQALDDTSSVVLRFGSFNGRQDVAMTLLDPEGTEVTFFLQGGGYGEVTQTANGFGVTLFNTGEVSQASVTGAGGDGRFDFIQLHINGSVASFYAPDARLRLPPGAAPGFQPFKVTTSVGSLTLGDIVGPMTFTIPATSDTPSLDLGNIRDLSINSSVGISSLLVYSWTDTTGESDAIRAPWIGLVDSLGNFGADLFLTGRSGGSPTLGDVVIGGVVKGATWSISGRGTSISALATTTDFSATFSLRIDSIATTTGTLRGVITARSIGAITSGRDILAAKILAGAYLGADGRLGGTGSDADVFRTGNIGPVNVTRNTANMVIAAGLDPIDGVFGNGNDRLLGGTASRITSIDVGNIAGRTSRFLANRYGPVTIGGVSIDPATDPRFQLATTPPTLLVERDAPVSGVGIGSVTVLFTSTNLMDLDSITRESILVTGDVQGWWVHSRALVAGTNGAAARVTFAVSVYDRTLVRPPIAISLVPGTIRDMRGNAINDDVQIAFWPVE